MNAGIDISTSQLTSLGTEIAFYVLLLIFTINGLFLGYHWFNYGTKRKTATIALATYLIGGAALFLTLALLLGNI
jgi:hypothetical protein